jgi:hypothetical protein
MIDLYTGFVIPVPLKGETTVDIARIVENNLIKVFGPPSEISSDNAANLGGPAMKIPYRIVQHLMLWYRLLTGTLYNSFVSSQINFKVSGQMSFA